MECCVAAERNGRIGVLLSWRLSGRGGGRRRERERDRKRERVEKLENCHPGGGRREGRKCCH